MPEQNKHTPREWYHSLCSTYITGKRVVKDNSQVPVVSLEFFQTVTPAVPDAMLRAVLDKLKEGGSITNSGRMRGFAKNDPKKSHRVENDTFTQVHDFTEAIIRAGEGHTGQKSCMTMGHSPNSTPLSERENSSRPDSFGRSTIPRYDDKGVELPRHPTSWSGIILAKEDKKDELESDALDNFAKIIWDGYHILRNDPRRNFCFGMTTENATCRLWFFARSHIMVSEPFNDHAPLVRFILSLSFAHVLSTASMSPLTAQSGRSTGCDNPLARPISANATLNAQSTASRPNMDENTPPEPTSRVSPLSAQSSRSTIHVDVSAGASPLYASVDYDFAWEAHGYDPTMQRLRHGVYRIRVGDTWYITAGTLSDSRAECICGRCTRVWRVYEDKKYEKGEEKVYYVLKDVWVDSSNNTEATIWRRLKEKLDSKVFDQHFLTLVAAFEPGEGATTCGFLRRGNYPHTENVDFMDNQFVSMLDLEPSTSTSALPEKVVVGSFDEDRFHVQGAPDVEVSARRTGRRARYHPRTHD